MKILDLEVEERGKVFWFGGLLAVRAFGKAIGWAGVQAILFKRWGLENLPDSFIIFAVLGMLGAMIYVMFADAYRRSEIFKWYAGLTGSLMLIASLILPYDPSSNWNVFVFSILIMAAYTLGDSTLGIQLWTIINDVFRPSQGVRVYPILIATSLIGGILGGIALQVLSYYLASELLIGLWGITILAGWPILMLLEEKYSDELQIHKPHQKHSLARNFKEGCAFAVRSKLIYGIASICLFFWAVASLKEFLYGQILNSEFPTEESLNIYYGYYTILINSTVLLLQLKITSEVIRKFGVGHCFCLLPGTIFLGLIAIGIWQNLWVAISMRYTWDVVGMTVQGSAFQLSFNAIPAPYRGRIRGLLEGIVNPFGGILGGIFLKLLTGLGQNIPSNSHEPFLAITWLGLILACVWLGIAFWIPEQYRQKVLVNLHSKDTRTQQDAWEMMREFKGHASMEESKKQQDAISSQDKMLRQVSTPLWKVQRNQERPLYIFKQPPDHEPTWVESNPPLLVLRKRVLQSQALLCLFIRYGEGGKQMNLQIGDVLWACKYKNERMMIKREESGAIRLVTAVSGIIYWKIEPGYIAAIWDKDRLLAIEIGNFGHEDVDWIQCTDYEFKGPYKLKQQTTYISPFARFCLDIEPIGCLIE